MTARACATTKPKYARTRMIAARSVNSVTMLPDMFAANASTVQARKLRLNLLEEGLEAIWIPKAAGQVGTQLVELIEEISVITEDAERDSEAGHDAEIIFFRPVLKERQQHAEGEDHRCKGESDAEYERQVLLSARPQPAQAR